MDWRKLTGFVAALVVTGLLVAFTKDILAIKTVGETWVVVWILWLGAMSVLVLVALFLCRRVEEEAATKAQVARILREESGGKDNPAVRGT